MELKEIRESFYNILKSFNFPVFMQGSMSQDTEYPETFLTYFFPTTQDEHFADNETKLKSVVVEVAIYSVDLSLIDEYAEKIKEKLKELGYGFVVGGDVASDEPTHTGYMQRFNLLY